MELYQKRMDKQAKIEYYTYEESEVKVIVLIIYK